jgi:hypothetical protein
MLIADGGGGHGIGMDGIIFVTHRRLSVEILPMILRGDPAETSSKIWYFWGGVLPDRRRIGAGSVVAGSVTDRHV